MQVHGIHMSSKSINYICIFTVYSLEIQLSQSIYKLKTSYQSQSHRITNEISMCSSVKSDHPSLGAIQSEVINMLNFYKARSNWKISNLSKVLW